MSSLPRDVGQYRLETQIGQGGMGVVYRATDTALDRAVAVKMISLTDDLSDEDKEQTVRRFQREAKSAAKIHSRHVVQVLNFGKTPAGELYIVMELLDGISLSKLLAREKRLVPARAIRIARQICRGLQAAHELGIVHRDLKAANVMIVSADGITEFAKVLDFGVAKMAEGGRGGATQTGAVVGTLSTMAPEQLEGKSVDARADIYSMGVLLYRMLTGTTLFETSDVAELIHRQLHEMPVAPTKRAPDANIPDELDAVVLRCLSKNPAERPSSMHEVENELASASGAEPTDPSGEFVVLQRSAGDPATGPTKAVPSAHVTRAVTRVKRQTRTRKAVAAGLAVVAILGAGFIFARAARGPQTAPAAMLPVVVPALAPPPVPAPEPAPMQAPVPTEVAVVLEGPELAPRPDGPLAQLAERCSHPCVAQLLERGASVASSSSQQRKAFEKEMTACSLRCRAPPAARAPPTTRVTRPKPKPVPEAPPAFRRVLTKDGG
jgi:serine/threonine-protein kinase